MEDSELTRKAIDELMREMDDYKDKSKPTERKKNPLGRPNKLFLGRTINSVMTHNKRQSDRNIQRCERKLKELDEKHRKRNFNKNRTNHSESESSCETFSDSYDARKIYETNKKTKKHKRHKKQVSRSSSVSSISNGSKSHSSSSSESTKKRNRKKKRLKKLKKEDEYEHDSYIDYDNEPRTEYYVDPNVAYAAMAYNQVAHFIQQQKIIQQQMAMEKLEESIEIPSDLSISCQSSPESSLNISINSSSAEEDENGILTFKLSSDDEENVLRINKEPSVINKNEKPPKDENDNVSVLSHISLESSDSQKNVLNETNEVYLISSCSDSEGLEFIETMK